MTKRNKLIIPIIMAAIICGCDAPPVDNDKQQPSEQSQQQPYSGSNYLLQQLAGSAAAGAAGGAAAGASNAATNHAIDSWKKKRRARNIQRLRQNRTRPPVRTMRPPVRAIGRR